MDEISIREAQRQRVAGAAASAGVALMPGRDAAIAAQLSGTLAACAPLRDALRFTDDPESVHALSLVDTTTGTAVGLDTPSGSGA